MSSGLKMSRLTTTTPLKQVGHVGALYGAFLAMMIGSGKEGKSRGSLMGSLKQAYAHGSFPCVSHFTSSPRPP